MRSRKRLLLAVLVIVFQVLVCLAVEPLPAAGKSHVDVAKVPEADSPQIAQQQKDVVAADASGTVNITSKHAAAEASAPDAAATTVQPSVEHAAPMDTATLNVGAMKRAIIVTCGFSVLVMMYLAFRSLRVNKARPQMVRKYGILAHRQDVEMRPLPLDEEDEDDTTIFDASNISAKRLVT